MARRHPVREPAVRRWVRRIGRFELAVLAGAAVIVTALSATLFIPDGSMDSPAGGGTAAPRAAGLTDLNVAVVPAVDSAGFFIALYQGLFRAHGLNVHFIPAVSSETEINLQAQQLPAGNPVEISCGAFPSYLAAQENWDTGQRASPAHPDVVAADLDIFAEGSIMTPGAQGLYVMPGSRIRTVRDLAGETIGVNAPGNILYLLVAAELRAEGVSVRDVRFAYIPLPAMGAALRDGAVAAVTLPEPFASQAELSMGVRLLADLDQGAMVSFPVQGCAVTKQWAAADPGTLAAFTAAYEEGQQIADTNRTAIERAMEELPAPLGVSREVAAVMAVDSYPIGVDPVRVQRVADVMRQYLGFPPFDVRPMLGGG